jgi:glucokinase
MNDMAIGVDIGGTKVLVVALDADNAVIGEQRNDTPANPRELVDCVIASIEALDVPIGSIGVGVAGLVTHDGEVLVSPHLQRPEDLHLRAVLGDHFGVGVTVDNDANAATWGEASLGAGRGVRDLVVVNLGTGIGAGIVANGAMVRGGHGFAGEAGHITVKFDGETHITGAKGPWEFYASGSALQREVNATLDAAYLRTDEGIRALDEYARAVAIGLGSVVSLLDPELVILGGGVAKIGEPLRAAVESHLQHWTLGGSSRTRLRVRLGQLGERAGAIGAALLGRN